MNKNLNVIPENADIVFIALNPTALAIKNGALFSRDESLWNILFNAGILQESIKYVDLKNRVNEVCKENKHTVNNLKIGIADLLPFVVESDSKNVNAQKEDAEELFKLNPQLRSAKKIVLLGQKVVDGFHKDFPSVPKWTSVKKIEEQLNNIKIFGKVNFGLHDIKVFAVPFPTNNNIPNKHKLYANIISM